MPRGSARHSRTAPPRRAAKARPSPDARSAPEARSAARRFRTCGTVGSGFPAAASAGGRTGGGHRKCRQGRFGASPGRFGVFPERFGVFPERFLTLSDTRRGPPGARPDIVGLRTCRVGNASGPCPERTTVARNASDLPDDVTLVRNALWFTEALPYCRNPPGLPGTPHVARIAFPLARKRVWLAGNASGSPYHVPFCRERARFAGNASGCPDRVAVVRKAPRPQERVSVAMP